MSGCGLLSVATGSAGKRALRRAQHLAKPYPIPYQGKSSDFCQTFKFFCEKFIKRP